MTRRLVAMLLVAAAGLSSIGHAAPAIAGPLPLEIAASVQWHDTRSSFELSPDGRWLAHTIQRPEVVPRGTSVFTETGYSLFEGGTRAQAVLTNTVDASVTKLGGRQRSSWAPVWSPDGRRVAFYSDDDGEAGVWIWDKATGTARRFPGVIARPAFGFEFVRWSADSQRILCKVLPEGISIAEANALIPRADATNRFPKVADDTPSVFVLEHVPDRVAVSSQDPSPAVPVLENVKAGNALLADLAILDLRTQEAWRVVPGVRTTWYAWSPDETRIAFSDLLGYEANAQQAWYALRVLALANGRIQSVAEAVRMTYGLNANWSPDGARIAYISTGQTAEGKLIVAPLSGAPSTTYATQAMSSLDVNDGEFPPVWDAAGKAIYAIGKDGRLWRIDLGDGSARIAAEIPDRKIIALVTRRHLPTIWTTDHGRSIWVIAQEEHGLHGGIYKVDGRAGTARAVLENDSRYQASFSVDGNDATGNFAYVAADQQHPQDAWILSTRTGKTRQVSHLNPEMERYRLGKARTIAWRTADGQALKGALLLPPGYRPRHRLPLVVFVYGGAYGSEFVNRFGFWEYPSFNMHVLATRGYAVLYPDAPLRAGRTLEDLAVTVLPGVDAAIAEGYADPEKLAVMGQSYGSFSTLALICQTTRFKAAIITAAVVHPDILNDYLGIGPDGSGSTGYYERGQGNMGGTPWEYPDRYRKNSPIWLFDRIETPLLIGQGTLDGNGTASDAIFAALKRLNKRVEYRLYDKEDHVLSRKPNIIDFWQRRLDFLDHYLSVPLEAVNQMH